MADLQIREFRPVKLTLLNVGPFREHTEIDFTDTVSADAALTGGAANLYLLVSKNGFGKTTILNSIFLLMNLLRNEDRMGFDVFDLDESAGRIQLDVRAVWTTEDKSSPVLLSIWAGSESPLAAWSEDELERVANASNWAAVGFRLSRTGKVTLSEATNELGRLLITAVRDELGRSPPALWGEGLHLPTAVYFPADRSLRRPPVGGRAVVRPSSWGYQPGFRFEVDGSTWDNSIDNLLVWLAWIQDERIHSLQEFVDKYVFMDGDKSLLEVDRERLWTNIQTPDGTHPLVYLSHGERQVLQLFVRLIVHMTSATLLLIDELEMHLHPRWRIMLLQSIKDLVKNADTLSVILTTHERELIREFDHETPEDGLIKGGFLIKQDL